MAELNYLSGFGNHFSSESRPGALPIGQNSPQTAPFDLYPEQLSGTAFTAPRPVNKRSWLYRIQPSVVHSKYEAVNNNGFDFGKTVAKPEQIRWSPPTAITKKTNFIEGITAWITNGCHTQFSGSSVYLYQCNQNMDKSYFSNADGDLLFIPEIGKLTLRTEFGIIEIEPSEIAVIPRGIKFSVDCDNAFARGYLCENYGQPFQIPDLGPIGANGLANPRDFLVLTATFESDEESCVVWTKFSGQLWVCTYQSSPLNVVAWHGNYVPFKYDLKLFNTINTVSFDHPDPSIFTVLTSPSGLPGTANLDFVIFPPRWMVAENTFRPPYFHRNIMSEFMGLIYGQYDAKETGFVPGGSSLHNCMSAHGPDTDVFFKATEQDLKPSYLANTLAFMLESRLPWQLSEKAAASETIQPDYLSCWQGLAKRFDDRP